MQLLQHCTGALGLDVVLQLLNGRLQSGLRVVTAAAAGEQEGEGHKQRPSQMTHRHAELPFHGYDAGQSGTRQL